MGKYRISFISIALFVALSNVADAQDEKLICQAIGFIEGKNKVCDSSANRIRQGYSSLYASGMVTIAANLSATDRIRTSERMEEVRELLWEGGIPPANIRLIDFALNDTLRDLKLRNNTCYLIYYYKTPAHIRMLGLPSPPINRDTLIRVGSSFYLQYTYRQYQQKDTLPQIHMLERDLQTKEELGLYEKVNTRGFTRELAFFQFSKSDSDLVPDHVIIPLNLKSFKSTMRLERYSTDKSAWIPVRDAEIHHAVASGQQGVGLRLNKSGVYRLLDVPEKYTRVLYFKAPPHMAFVKAEMEQDVLTRYEGIMTDAETGVVFALPSLDTKMTCRFVLKDGRGRIHYLPEGDWNDLIDREVKVLKNNKRKITIQDKVVALPDHAFRLQKDLHDVRTMALDHIK